MSSNDVIRVQMQYKLEQMEREQAIIQRKKLERDDLVAQKNAMEYVAKEAKQMQRWCLAVALVLLPLSYVVQHKYRLLCYGGTAAGLIGAGVLACNRSHFLKEQKEAEEKLGRVRE